MRITPDMTPHPITSDLIPALYQLNQDHAVELSSLTRVEYEAIIEAATYARAVGEGGFILAFDQCADYESPNYRWFRDRYARFLYVDRIVISPQRRGEGLARKIYADLFAFANEAGADFVCAEVNSEPPNPSSDAFHAAMGFETVGEARLEDRGKTVRYIARKV